MKFFRKQPAAAPKAQPPLRVHRQNRRSLVMKLTPVGIAVFIPRHLKPDSATVRAFIEDGLRKIGPRPALDAPDIRSAAQLRDMVAAWSQRLGVQPKRVQMRAMYRKWGSCSSGGNITLSTALLRVPEPLAEYVVVHELAHLRELNHGKAFKALLSAHLPDWREREEALHAFLGPAPVD